jgi:hypothetical protein
MRRALVVTLFSMACGAAALYAQGDGGYRLVADWPKLPAGMYFGLKDAPPPPAEREAQAAARRARGNRGAGGSGGMTQTPQPGISGLAIYTKDRRL